MEIVAALKCIQQLNDDVKEKIVKKQNEAVLFLNNEGLELRLENREFCKSLLQSLSRQEKETFLGLLKNHSMYAVDCGDTEEILSSEERVARLLLQQKGITYQLQHLQHKQPYIIPAEFVESYLELSVNVEDICSKSPYYGDKSYLYYLMELVFAVKTNTSSFSKVRKQLEERISSQLDWQMLLNFLIEKGVVIGASSKLTVLENACHELFQLSTEKLHYQLAKFVITSNVKQPFCSYFLLWAFTLTRKALQLTEIKSYLTNHECYNGEDLANAFKQLKALKLIHEKNNVIFPLINELELASVNGIETGVLQCLLPASLKNQELWGLRCWGEVKCWEEYIQFSFTRESVIAALKEGYNLRQLLTILQAFFQKEVIGRWEATLNQWFAQGTPVFKKTNLVYYGISEELHLRLIKDQWSGWFEQTANGVVIEEKLMADFEQFLASIHLHVKISKQQLVERKEKRVTLKIVNEYPTLQSVLPELAQLPKQWFTPTSYHEKTLRRIIKQAIVLQLKLNVEKQTMEKSIVKPLQLINKNGSQLLIADFQEVILLDEIVKLSIEDPLQAVR